MERKKASGDLPSVPLRPPASSDTFLKDVQAAFKRHRSLGTMPSTQLRARRIPVPQLSGKGDGSGDSASPANPDDSSSSALSVSGTISDPDKKDDGAVEGSALVNASSQGNGEVALRDNCRMKTTEPNGPGNQGMGISGWMSMAKIQVGSTPGPEQVNVPDMSLLKVGSLEKVTQQHQNAQHMDPVTQCSTVGSSCATTMSMHSGPTAQSTHAAFAMQTALTPMARHGVERSGIAQGYAGMDYASRGVEIPGGLKESCSNGVVGRKEADAALVAPQPQVGLERNPSNVDGDPSTKPEKVRKKKYDPDMFFKVNGKLYQRLGKIGSGGSSEVYKVISSDCTIYALKRIKLKGRDYPTAHGFYQEIEYLNKLKGKNNIIELVDYELTDKTLLEEVQSGTLSNKDGKIRDDTLIYMVLEYGEIDLAHMLSQKWKEIKNMKLHENWLRFYWQQMLEAVNTIHEERIVHSDLKPANFLLVKGSLKLIDFGIAKAITSDTTNIQRDAQVGTLNYMSPEAFMWNEKDGNGNTIKCGRPSDIWSLGCILYQMVYGKTPFADFKTFWAKFKVITDRNHKIEYGPISNPWLIDLMKKCLSWDRDERWRIPQLLQHPFLNPPMPPLEVTDQS